MASHVTKIQKNKGLLITRDMLDRVGVSDAVEVSEEPGRIVITPLEQDSHERVMGLLHKWQQEYGLPARPDGRIHVPAAQLFAEWEAEEALMTPEEIQAEQLLWEDILQNGHPVEI